MRIFDLKNLMAEERELKHLKTNKAIPNPIEIKFKNEPHPLKLQSKFFDLRKSQVDHLGIILQL